MEKGIIKELLGKVPQTGRVHWIGIRPERQAPLQSVAQVLADAETGLSGDHAGSRRSKKRQVTLIQYEHLVAVAGMLHQQQPIDPALTRRNIVVRGINLLALRDQVFQIGEAVLEATGLCYPCSRMEQTLGPGGYNAMRGHGGLTATILTSGVIALHDPVSLVRKAE